MDRETRLIYGDLQGEPTLSLLCGPCRKTDVHVGMVYKLRSDPRRLVWIPAVEIRDEQRHPGLIKGDFRVTCPNDHELAADASRLRQQAATAQRRPRGNPPSVRLPRRKG